MKFIKQKLTRKSKNQKYFFNLIKEWKMESVIYCLFIQCNLKSLIKCCVDIGVFLDWPIRIAIHFFGIGMWSINQISKLSDVLRKKRAPRKNCLIQKRSSQNLPYNRKKAQRVKSLEFHNWWKKPNHMH